MIYNASELMIQTMLFLVHNNHAMQSRIDTNTLYYVKTGESKWLLWYAIKYQKCDFLHLCTLVKVFTGLEDKLRPHIRFGMGSCAVISAKNHKRQRRKRQSVTAEREKSQTP